MTADTLIVQGHHDGVVLAKHTRRLVRRMGGLVAYHEIPGDHMLPFDSWPSWPTVCQLITSATRPFAATVEAEK